MSANGFILITGALGGLGSALARECARRGYDLFLTDQLANGEEFAANLTRLYGIQVRYAACQLTSAEERSGLLENFAQQGLRFQGLMNVAGRDFEGAFLSRTRREVTHLSELMITANLEITHAVLALRQPDTRFMLVNVGSLAAFFPMPYKAVYSSTKRFLLNFTLALREEMKDFGNALILCPAGLPTHAASIEKMKAQGFWGRATMSDTAVVARRTLDLVQRGRAVYVPGAVNQLFAWLSGWLPPSLLTAYLGRRWRSGNILDAVEKSPLEGV